jgi:hypothetical protein
MKSHCLKAHLRWLYFSSIIKQHAGRASVIKTHLHYDVFQPRRRKKEKKKSSSKPSADGEEPEDLEICLGSGKDDNYFSRSKVEQF